MKVSSELDLNRIEELVYISPNSPLFARQAFSLADKGKINEAIKICETGLQKYRFYISGYIILAKLFFEKKDYKSAFVALKNALTIAPNCPAAIECLIEWKEKLDEKSNLPSELDSVDKNLNQKKFLNSTPHVIEKIDIQNKIKIKDELERILEKFEKSNSLVIKADPTFNMIYEPPPHKEVIATETLCAVYLSQGLYKEAVSVLERLQEKDPSKKGEYTAKIQALKEKLEISKSIS
ncbi:MAG: hypothetical protein FJ213_04195 [Ignavibacteria bacterium]|nr:hypothetical protein [Ignavibacteria bacterium]